jgi:hypothetical protein
MCAAATCLCTLSHTDLSSAFVGGSMIRIIFEPQLGRLCPMRRQRPQSVVRPGHEAPLLTVVDRP